MTPEREDWFWFNPNSSLASKLKNVPLTLSYTNNDGDKLTWGIRVTTQWGTILTEINMPLDTPPEAKSDLVEHVINGFLYINDNDY